MIRSSVFQLKTPRIHLRTGGDLSDGAAAHDPEPRFPGDQLHAAALLQGPPHHRRAGLLPQPHQVPRDVSKCQQRAAAQAGTAACDARVFSFEFR